MYNLFVTFNEDNWEGNPFDIGIDRVYASISGHKFDELTQAEMAELKRLPCIFAYEGKTKKAPKFGRIKEVIRRDKTIRIEYEIIQIEPFLSLETFAEQAFNLGITGKFELEHTHWATKNVDIARELKRYGITLPAWAKKREKTVNITNHNFLASFSFPGEVRDVVKEVADELEHLLGSHSYFYDNNYKSQLARPSLNTLLQDIYRNRSKLVVVFLSEDYQRKKWCGVEFRAIQEMIMEMEHEKILYVRMDNGKVEGVFNTDGYLDGRTLSPSEIAQCITERVELLQQIAS